MSKYVIKNCPSFYKDFCGADDTDYFCCNETNCVMKQIIDLCKKAPILNADWILDKLDIQEVEMLSVDELNEIEKMYENVGIEKTFYNIYTNECIYPPFTAEKQIAILKLLTQRCDLSISHFTKWEFIHFDGQEPTQVTGKDFAETFARLINAYWQSLTEEEKQQVKGILE